MKNIIEIYKLHDLLQRVIDSHPKSTGTVSPLACLRAAHEVTCWVLGHADEGALADFIARMDKYRKDSTNQESVNH